MEKPLYKSTGIWGSVLLMALGVVQIALSRQLTPDAVESIFLGLTGFGIRRAM